MRNIILLNVKIQRTGYDASLHLDMKNISAIKTK